MNRKSRILFISLAVLALAGLGWAWQSRSSKASNNSAHAVMKPRYGSISTVVSTTGDVQPQNRLAIKPPVSGRIEEILVREGARVRKGQTLAWMSSTERAALLDSARSQGEANIAYWEEVYKATPVISPIDGEVIVRSVEPGQTIASGETILVLSDRLIVKAQVDETDIGKIKVGQSATLSLDAYPDIQVSATVDHIAYESEVVSNVVIYKVDILPATVPPVFRSGMSANVDVITASKENVLLVPAAAVQQGTGKPFVLLSRGDKQEPERRHVVLGLSGDEKIEIVDGIVLEDRLVVANADFSYTKGGGGGPSNPLMPQRRRAGGNTNNSGGNNRSR